MFSTDEQQEVQRRWTITRHRNSINEGGQGAGQEKVHAKSQRGPAVEVRVGVGAAPDRTQLRNGAGYGPRVSGTGGGGRNRLAVAGRLGRRRTGSQTVWQPARAGRSGATAVTTGLEYHPSATATSSSSDPAVGVGRIPACESRGVSLQLVLRTLSTLAATPGCGAASRTQGRGEDVRGLGGGNHPRV